MHKFLLFTALVLSAEVNPLTAGPLAESSGTLTPSRSSSIPMAPIKYKVESRTFNRGLDLIHIPKTAGTNLVIDIFRPYFKKSGQPFRHFGHTPLSKIPRDWNNNMPTCVWLRDPLARAKSLLMFTKNSSRSLRTPTPANSKGGWVVTQNGAKFFQQVFDADFNKVADLKGLANVMQGDYDNYLPGGACFWPLLPYAAYFAPYGLDVTTMDDKKVDLCVKNALERIDFFGEVETLEDSLNALNIAFDLKIDPTLARRKVNQASNTVQKIDLTRPDVKAFFDKLLVWEYKIYNKLLAAQRTRVAMSLVNQKNKIIQYKLPSGFDPELYISLNPDLKKSLKKSAKKDIWKRRKMAMIHFIEKGIHDGRTYIKRAPSVSSVQHKQSLSLAKHKLKAEKKEAKRIKKNTKKTAQCTKVPSNFNAAEYMSKYHDLQKSFGRLKDKKRRLALWHHYVSYGVNERRSYKNGALPFNVNRYLSKYSDLQKEFGKMTNLQSQRNAVVNHYFNFGIREGRNFN